MSTARQTVDHLKRVLPPDARVTVSQTASVSRYEDGGRAKAREFSVCVRCGTFLRLKSSPDGWDGPVAEILDLFAAFRAFEESRPKRREPAAPDAEAK
jgi:hypothetical protein